MSKPKLAFHELINPTFQALKQLGGSGTNQEIHDETVAILGLSDEQIAAPHKPGQSSPTRIAYRLGWVKTWLKHYGVIENSKRGVWALTARGQTKDKLDGKQVVLEVNAMIKAQKDQQLDSNQDADESFEPTVADDAAQDQRWRQELSAVLKDMDPTAFERLCQRILRESGFTRVEVTSASHDGGIDGKGILQVNDFLSFRVEFQCKRYSGSVGPDVVQKLRGAMSGSADRGLIVTTGSFTQGARAEATREDKVPIELVDGEELVDKLKALELGLSTRLVEQVTIHADFFNKI